MRPIDADGLICNLRRQGGYEEVIELIDSCPTFEPNPVGEEGIVIIEGDLVTLHIDDWLRMMRKQKEWVRFLRMVRKYMWKKNNNDKAVQLGER